MTQADSNSSPSRGVQQTTETVPNTYSNPKQFQDDAIDFYDLGITLWRWKWLVVAITVFAALGSIIYAFQQQSIFKSKALLLPPKNKDFQAINLSGVQLGRGIYFREKGFELLKTDITANDVFMKFKQNIKSREIQKKFIHSNNIFDILAPNKDSETRVQDVYQAFADLIKLEEENGVTTLSIEMYNAEYAAQWVNDLIIFVDKETTSMLIEDLENQIQNQIKDIQYTIRSKRLMAEKRREDQIDRYTEHAEIAKKLGMIGRVNATNIIQNTQMSADSATGVRRQSTATSPLYYHGYQALMTEINVLRNRKSDDPFITGLRDLQERLTMLQSIKLDRENMRSITFDQKAFASKSPYKPNRRLLVSITTLVGFFSGIFLAFFIEFVNNQRKKHSV